ncbi:TetR family transcriptional regulator [Cryptosporangium sp. NPDC051539]|uniref:TetR/AcrR family transcriptional regulator n=1 Tax=Cryptosporangium sp. NPDC051539 TaxID=3363962 RepID=UPI0037B9435E
MANALSRERIVDAAIELLDVSGEGGLTFRTLSAQLKTGPGAIYWHVANKSELLVAAAHTVLADAMADDAVLAAPEGAGGSPEGVREAPEGVKGAPEGVGEAPEGAVRALALGLFDAIDDHPWVGVQLSRVSSQATALQIFERLGRQIEALGVPATAQFDAASALLNYILGVAAQNATRTPDTDLNRPDYLGAVAAGLDPDEFPFTRKVAEQLRDHDDRAQFLAGVGLILAGIRSTVSGVTRDAGE